MAADRSSYPLLAALLAYPGPGYAARVDEALRALSPSAESAEQMGTDPLGDPRSRPHHPRADQVAQGVSPLRGEDAAPGTDPAAHLRSFAAAIADSSTADLQELCTRTFDINPACCLEVGWLLYGDNYNRGEFLVRLRQDLRRHGIEESSELPDHLTHVLSLLAAMDDAEAADFTLRAVLPAVGKMAQGLHGRDNPYAHLLAAIGAVLAEHTPLPAPPAAEATP